jgi:hypothetical protein
MKRLFCLFFVCFFSILAFSQETDSLSTEEEYYEDLPEDEYPILFFTRLSLSMFTINALPAELEVGFWDDSVVATDSIYGTTSTNRLWTYGLNFGLGFLINEDLVLNLDNHFGWGAGGRLFNYNFQLGLGKEFRFNQFFVQPIFSLGFVSTNFRIGEYPPLSKDYFFVNGWYIYDNLTVRLKGRAFTISPALYIEYQLRREISIFGKASINYAFWDNHFITVSGKTDEFDEDGNAITATERIGFDDGRLEFRVNNQLILDADSPFFHYNLNGVLFQLGVSIGLGWNDAEEFMEEF